MQTFKVLFIDIDGVLHRGFEPGELTVAGATLDELRQERADLFGWAGLLAAALGHHECEVIVHSSWRAYVSDNILRDCLGPLRRRLRGCTPRTLTREASIREVVRSRRLGAESYRVLDDDSSEFEDIRNQLIVCNPVSGVNDSLVLTQLRDWFGLGRIGAS